MSPRTRLLFKAAAGLVLVVLAVGLWGASHSAGQALTDLQQRWRWHQYTTDQGLPALPVLGLLETTTGTVWVHTAGGLAWYDGYGWHQVQQAGLPLRSPTLALPDHEGGLLVIANETLYQGDKKGFSPLPLTHAGATIHAYDVAALGPEDFVVVSGKALYRYQQGRTSPFPLPEAIARFPTPSMTVVTAATGTLWLNSAAGGYWWDGQRWQRRFDHPIRYFDEGPWGGILSINDITHLEGVWTWSQGQPPRHVGLPARVTAMDTNSPGDAIVAYADGEVTVRRQQRWQSLSPIPLPLANVTALLLLDHGNLWVGNEEGVAYFRATARRWTRLDVGGDQVNEILLTRDGNLWIGSNIGLHIRHPDGTLTHHYAIGDTPIAGVTAMAQDAQGHVWIGSGSGFEGAFRWDGQQWTHVGPDDGLKAPRIHRIATDRSGSLWFLGHAAVFGGTTNAPEPGAFRHVEGQFQPWGPAQGLPSGRVYAFDEGPDGAYWFGTLSGLSRWHEGVWTHWLGTQAGLKTSRIFNLAVDDEGNLWFIHQHSLGHGLGRLDATERLHYFTVNHGLMDNRVWEVETDADGSLWIGTQTGLARYHQETFAAFGPATGLTHPHIWPILPLKDHILVGSIGGGLYRFDLTEARSPAPKVQLVSSVLATDDILLRWIPLAYDGEQPSSRIETRFRWNAAPWSPWATVRESSLLNLPPGTHTFTVQAKGLFGQVDPAGTSITFSVAPPFYQHPLFIVLISIGILLIAGAFWGRKQKHDALLRQQSRLLQAAQETERRRIAQALHDEVGGTLTALQLTLKMAGGGHNAPTDLDEATHLVDDLMQKVRQLSLLLRPGMLDELGLHAATYWMVEQFKKQLGVPVLLQLGIPEKTRYGVEVETTAYRIIQEALTNIARHANPSQVSVRLNRQGGDLIVKVEDDGQGFDVASTLSHPTSLGLSGMRERAALLGGTLTLTSSPQRGTLVQARIPIGTERLRTLSSFGIQYQ